MVKDLKKVTQYKRKIFFTLSASFGDTLASLGSCTNDSRTRIVENLSLGTTSHSKPYKLGWLLDHGELVVNKKNHHFLVHREIP